MCVSVSLCVYVYVPARLPRPARKTQHGRILLNSFYCRNASMLLRGPQEPREVCLYTLSPPHPLTAGHAASPGTQLQLLKAAGAYLHQTGFTGILVHLRSSQDVCGLYEEVRCKSYDLATVPGAFGTAATPAPNISPFFLFWQRGCL